ncbi:MAG: outer membrane lipoprotein carrier protein LolA [Bacteroidales bacterium]|jgi:outer membrane lipoprotein-sorting protein|nr:outer membrane lipoprotein carrier protein LolA [Bacteroidales bacterium]
MYKLIIILLFPLVSMQGQSDTRSPQILDDMVAKFKSYPTVQLNFTANVIQLQDKSETKETGKIWLKGNKYKLELLPSSILYFNGVKLFQYLPEVKEVNVTQPDMEQDNEDFQLLNPQSFFNLSSENFKSNLAKESTQYNRKVYEIDLYPVRLKTTKYSRIRLFVEKTSLQIVYLKAVMKDGTRYELTFEPYNVQKSLPDSFFEFQASLYPGVEVIDLTF